MATDQLFTIALTATITGLSTPVLVVAWYKWLRWLDLSDIDLWLQCGVSRVWRLR